MNCIINFNFFVDIFQNPNYQNDKIKSKKGPLWPPYLKNFPVISFYANGFFLYPLKTEEQGFSDIFRV